MANGDSITGLSTEQVTIDLPSMLSAQIDAYVGTGFVDQAEFIRTAVRHYLEYLQVASRSAQSDATR